MNLTKDYIETRIGLWLYDRGFLGLIRLAFKFMWCGKYKVREQIYKEIFGE